MDTKHADALVDLADGVAGVCARANDKGLTDGEIANELRRIADEMDAEMQRMRPDPEDDYADRAEWKARR